MLFLYIPIYFFIGIKNPESKINTIVTSILMIMGSGLFLTLVNTNAYIQNHSNEISNQALQDTYISITEQNNAILISSVKDSIPKNTKVFIQNCDRICKKIENMKLQLINKTEGKVVKKINYDELGRLNDYDISSFILFKNREDVSEDKEELLKLKEDLTGLNKSYNKPLFDLTNKKEDQL